MILTDFRDKLAFYRMFYLFLSFMDLLKKIEIPLAEHGERTARTLLVEFGEKLLSMMDVFNWLQSVPNYPVVENAISQLARRFASLYDHPTNRNLTNFDHFFKEVTAFEELVAELVRCETEELDQCAHDTPSQARVIAEVGAVLTKIAEAVGRARSTDWTSAPVEGSSTWINQPRSMKYFIQHLNVSFNLLGQREALIGVVNDQLLDDILAYTVGLSRLVLGEQDHCQRNNSQIIAKLYEIGQTDLALELAFEFHDFTLLIRHSHTALNGDERHEFVEKLKREFKAENFEMHLYEYYRRNKMVDYLLEERGENLDNFLAHHEDIAWIRAIEAHQYKKARQTLANLVLEANDPQKKATIAALAKMCALCEHDVDPGVVAEFSATLDALKDHVPPVVSESHA
ncbi:Nucleoporin-C domain-containing protein [Aphelenchoides fujianensis]|nr:Nucleoporin-C domain-containing protein [Aphelenchoides fujianensis]